MSENARPEARAVWGWAGKGRPGKRAYPPGFEALRGIPAWRDADNGCRCG